MKELFEKGRGFVRNMRRMHISAFAAGSAFFWFLSLIPMLMLLSAVITYTPLTKEDLQEGMESVVPGAMEGFLHVVIEDVYAKAQALLPLAVVILLWTAGKGVLSLVQGLNFINHVEEHRGFLLMRLLAMIYTVILLVVLVMALGLISFGNGLEERLKGLSATIGVLYPFRFILFWLVLTVVFSLMYAYLPDRKLKLRHQFPGAGFAAVAWSVFSFGFSIYLEYGNSSDVYGSLTVLIGLMLWLYFCMYIIFVGAYINRYFSA